MRSTLIAASLLALALSTIPASAGLVVRTSGGVYVNVDWRSGTVIVDVKKKRRATVKY